MYVSGGADLPAVTYNTYPKLDSSNAYLRVAPQSRLYQANTLSHIKNIFFKPITFRGIDKKNLSQSHFKLVTF